jgi:eukaryotic-like serine/threonine-protein kinase
MNVAADQVREIFLAALRLPPEQRDDYLQEVCPGAADLRERVKRLIQAHVELGSLVDTAASPTRPLTDPPPVSEHAGLVLAGRYRLVEEIGEGGMGTVWLAQQTEPFERLVAIKFVKAGMDSKQVIARFEAERQALALMDHPNIARVLDAGTTGAGRPFFVMDLVKGVPITRYCDEHHLTPRQRLELFIPICQAVQHAHQKGIIHRDLKPSNVLVALDDGRPVPKVIDFGVAKAAGQTLTEKTLVTGFGALVGTLEYMSPEQAEINQLDIDTRSDIYSLGVLLYELLTGTTPFTRKDLEKGGMLEMLRVIREQEPSKPSTKLSTAEGLPTLAANRGTEPAKLRRLVRGELDWIVMKALEKDRNRRYETANGFAMDLQRYLADEPVQACPPSAWYCIGKFARRNKAVLVTGSVVAVAILVSVAGLAASTVVIAREQQETKNALHAEIRANEKLAKALDRESDLLYLHRTALAHRLWLGNNPGRAGQLLDECPAGRRRWEWHYLERLCHSELVTFRTGPKESLFEGVAFSPGGRYLAAANLQQGLRVWDLTTGQEVLPLCRPIKFLSSVAFSPDGRRLAAATGFSATGGEVWVWDAATGREVGHWAAHRQQVFNLAFDPGGRRLATASYDKTAKVWDAATGQELRAIAPARNWWHRCVAFSPDGKHLATAGPFNEVTLRDAESGREVHTFRGHTAAVVRVAFSPDGRYLVSAGVDRTARVWDLATRAERVTYRRHTGEIHALAIAPDGRLVATGSKDQAVRVWDADTGEDVARYLGHDAWVQGVAFSPDGKRLASAGHDGAVKVWDATCGQEARTLAAGKIAWGVAFGPGPRLTAACTTPDLRGEVRLWDPRTGAQRLRIAADARSAHAVALSPDGLLVASGGDDNTVRLWDAATGQGVHTLKGHAAAVHGVTFSSDGVRLASCDLDGVVKVWSVATGQAVWTPAQHPRRNQRSCIAFHPDGRRLAWDRSNGAVTIWDLATRQEVQVLLGHTSMLTGLAFSPDGERLASAGLDRTVRVWDLAAGREVHTLHGHTAMVTGVAFSPDGARLASAGHDDVVRIWDAESGQEILTLHGHGRNVQGVAFSPDGFFLASAARDGTVKVWDATPLGEKPGPAGERARK